MNLKKLENRFKILFNRRPFLIIVSAPSGCGKTTILKLLMERLNGLSFSVSHTTRPKRMGETTGKDYHFVERDTFLQMRDKDEFLESALVHSNYYGTSYTAIDNLLSQGFDVILDIDVQGMQLVKDSSNFEIVTIFIYPPSLVELENRLRKRNTDSDLIIAKRISNAAREMEFACEYDYTVVNDDIDIAVDNVCSIVKSERLRSCRLVLN